MSTRGRPASPPPRPTDPRYSHLCLCERICKQHHPGGQWLNRGQLASHQIGENLARTQNQRGRGNRAATVPPGRGARATSSRGVLVIPRARGRGATSSMRPQPPPTKRFRTPSPTAEDQRRVRTFISPPTDVQDAMETQDAMDIDEDPRIQASPVRLNPTLMPIELIYCPRSTHRELRVISRTCMRTRPRYVRIYCGTSPLPTVTHACRSQPRWSRTQFARLPRDHRRLKTTTVHSACTTTPTPLMMFNSRCKRSRSQTSSRRTFPINRQSYLRRRLKSMPRITRHHSMRLPMTPPNPPRDHATCQSRVPPYRRAPSSHTLSTSLISPSPDLLAQYTQRRTLCGSFESSSSLLPTCTPITMLHFVLLTSYSQLYAPSSLLSSSSTTSIQCHGHSPPLSNV